MCTPPSPATGPLHGDWWLSRHTLLRAAVCARALPRCRAGGPVWRLTDGGPWQRLPQASRHVAVTACETRRDATTDLPPLWSPGPAHARCTEEGAAGGGRPRPAARQGGPLSKRGVAALRGWGGVGSGLCAPPSPLPHARRRGASSAWVSSQRLSDGAVRMLGVRTPVGHAAAFAVRVHVWGVVGVVWSAGRAVALAPSPPLPTCLVWTTLSL